ncbi:DUF4256 domain-containing protein [Sphingobacterium bovistauri]|uniref:DUF4256 domain-containing protein n=1 Tax=Sphingobacterium bovistauri TaxID=2781959 RepID=A0ABS7Z5A3_9SPHI|nr:DUF4256 domain-containing protein [Sphingobacterium bovistauri]MCA5005317.1 DUF4256 domain-containing protein [Sphingobacterium bovistauri]
MKKLSQEEQNELLNILEQRFKKNPTRHPNIQWDDVLNKLINNDNALYNLFQMEETIGEPDVVELSNSEGKIFFIDCSSESPKGRRSICYDHEALESRKQYKPEDSAVNMANEMGIDLLNEDQYFQLQKFGDFDLKTSSWIKTSVDVRKNGGALFGDKRFGRVFIYHNGADSYYGARGFRGILELS